MCWFSWGVAGPGGPRLLMRGFPGPGEAVDEGGCPPYPFGAGCEYAGA